MNPVELTLPPITRPLVLAYGQDENGQEITATFHWKINALSRANYPAFVALNDEGTAKWQRQLNEANTKDAANLKAALEPKKRGKKAEVEPEVDAAEVSRYQKVDTALLALAEDMEKSRQLAEAKGQEADFVGVAMAQMSQVSGFIAQMSAGPVRTPEELEQEIQERREAEVTTYAELLNLRARMVCHLVHRVEFTGRPPAPCTVELLETYFDSDYLFNAINGIIEAMKAPLGTRGATAAS